MRSLKKTGKAFLIASGIWIAFSFLSDCSRRIVSYQEVHDSYSLPQNFRKVGNILIMEDYNYWPTNSVAYLGESGVVFFDAPWAEPIARQMLWKATVHSRKDFQALIITDHRLHRSGAMAAFSARALPILMQRETYQAARKHWSQMQSSASRSFSTWQKTEFIKPEALIGDHFTFQGGDIEIYYPGKAYSPGNLVVYFPKEKAVYAGSMLSVQPFHSPESTSEGMLQMLDFVETLDVETVISGHGSPVHGRSLLRKIRKRILKNTENL